MLTCRYCDVEVIEQRSGPPLHRSPWEKTGIGSQTSELYLFCRITKAEPKRPSDA